MFEAKKSCYLAFIFSAGFYGADSVEKRRGADSFLSNHPSHAKPATPVAVGAPSPSSLPRQQQGQAKSRHHA
ncbi:hypothetical protein HBH56_162270 [Parastagonospora nodorum]|nr:hypothetical protein HBH56_162270 [Parastagonospora nodorum]KAH3969078.1 hypothetical protein HBH52_175670 [Parastagonospora nodorum]KAH3993750.1 hypothetical protein HBI10_196080 [Parastagonospora nodorum]KAH4044695.1 hypothetical protein HBH49_211890 [Parastagonospora nodorum]KAH4064313.1 hypothetical protein HBH50_177560 [Parastagonospora nodorum]